MSHHSNRKVTETVSHKHYPAGLWFGARESESTVLRFREDGDKAKGVIVSEGKPVALFPFHQESASDVVQLYSIRRVVPSDLIPYNPN